jgi:hypothetical protein
VKQSSTIKSKAEVVSTTIVKSKASILLLALLFIALCIIGSLGWTYKWFFWVHIARLLIFIVIVVFVGLTLLLQHTKLRAILTLGLWAIAVVLSGYIWFGSTINNHVLMAEADSLQLSNTMPSLSYLSACSSGEEWFVSDCNPNAVMQFSIQPTSLGHEDQILQRRLNAEGYETSVSNDAAPDLEATNQNFYIDITPGSYAGSLPTNAAGNVPASTIVNNLQIEIIATALPYY